jgi:hypothetical protein
MPPKRKATATAHRLEATAKVQAAESQRAEAVAKVAAADATYQRLKEASATPGVIAGNELVQAEKQGDAARAQVKAVEGSIHAAEASVAGAALGAASPLAGGTAVSVSPGVSPARSSPAGDDEAAEDEATGVPPRHGITPTAAATRAARSLVVRACIRGIPSSEGDLRSGVFRLPRLRRGSSIPRVLPR